MTYEEAIKTLKPIVGNSNINAQPFIDFTLGNSELREEYQKAIMILRQEVAQGRITEVEVKQELGRMV